MVTKIWMSMQNCGDGSAYPKLMESKELAELDQDNMDEGWGGSCVSSITIEHEEPIIIRDKIYTVDDEIKETEEDLEYSLSFQGRLDALKKLKACKEQ